MTTLMPTSAEEAVANGAQLLDERYPFWWREVDPGTLRIWDCSDCVCGQLAARVYPGTSAHPQIKYMNFRQQVLLLSLQGEEEVRYGFFDGGQEGWGWANLAQEWRKVIHARLEADELLLAGETVEQTEEVAV